MLRRLLHPALHILLPLLFSSALTAQSVRVSVVEAGSGAAVADAMVRLEDAGGALVRSAFSGPQGDARIRVPAGEYTLRVQRSGYLPAQLRVRTGEGEAAVRVELRPRPLSMDTLQVIAAGEDERGRDAFRRRSEAQEGVFLDPAYMRQRWDRRYVGDMLVDAPGMDVKMMPRTGRREAVGRRGWECLTMLVNGRVMRMESMEPAHRNIDFWVRPRDIVAVEIYHHASEVPMELRRHVWQQAPDLMARPCGVINYWTRDRW